MMCFPILMCKNGNVETTSKNDENKMIKRKMNSKK
jgi:hypothetical protein